MSETASGHVEADHVEADHVEATGPADGTEAPDSTELAGDTTDPAADSTEPAADSTEPAGDSTEPAGDSTEPAGGQDPVGEAVAPSGTDGTDGSDRTTGTPVGAPAAADFNLVLVAAVNVTLPNQHPTVTLREIDSPRRQLSFSIGFQDGVVLSHALRRIPTPRPLTHELMTGVLQGFDIDVVAVRLVGRQGAVYFAELDLRGRSNRSVHACRPSDALCLALLQPVPVPILVDHRLFEQSGDIDPAGATPAPT